jgi:tetratricopeptide (TPR) repeat protein
MATAIDIDSLPGLGEDSKLGAVVRKFADEYTNDPSGVTNSAMLGGAYCHYGEFEAAAKIYEFGVETFPNNHSIWKGRADLLARCPDVRFHNSHGALSDAKRALNLARENGAFEGRPYMECRYLETLAASFAISNDFKSAIESLRSAILIAKTKRSRRRLERLLVVVEFKKPLLENNWNRASFRRH